MDRYRLPKPKRLSKRGNEIVEAAIVVPIFVLMVVSIIGLGIFYFNSFSMQCEIQKEIVQERREVKLPVKRISMNGENFAFINGFIPKTMHRNYSAYAYAIDEATLLRTGEMVGLR